MGFDVPQNVVEDIIRQRIECEGRETTNAEVVAYLLSASGTAPLNHDAFRICMHEFRRYLEWKGIEVPDFVEDIELSDYEKGILNKLKEDIRRSQKKALRGEKHEKESVVPKVRETVQVLLQTEDS